MEDEESTRKELRARIKELHTHSYLTLLSIGQAVTFHLLTEKISECRDIFFTRPHLAIQFTSWAAAIETFIVLILVWNDVFMVVSIYTWIPSLIDAVILFCLFATEVAMAKTIDDPFHWLISFIFLLVFSLAAFGNTYIQTKRRAENQKMFELNHNRMEFSMALIGILLVALIVIAAATMSHPASYWVGITFAALLLVMFIFNAVSHWDRIKAFIDNKGR